MADGAVSCEENYVDWKGRPASASKHGGMRAAIFIFVAESLENMAFISNATNLITYFTSSMHYSMTEAANMLTNYMGTAFLLTLLGGFLSDSFISRFWTIILFASVQLLGLLMLTLQAHFPSLKPPACGGKARCEHPRGGEEAMLYVGLYVVAMGAGAVKASLPAQGADQFEGSERRVISSFFNWYFFSLCAGGLVAVTLVVWVQENVGWQWGFGLSTAAIFLALAIFALGLTTYRNKIPSGSPLTRIAQVVTAAIRNRKLSLPADSKMLYHAESSVHSIQQTKQFRFLDKAALGGDWIGSSTSRWRMCSMRQVEETKLVVRVFPVFASTIMMNCCLAQLQTFSVQQGITMDRSLNNLEIPAASLTAIPLLFMIIAVPLYDQVFVRLARGITGHENGITHLQRVGIGLLLSAVAMGVAAMVESKRKAVAARYGLLESSEALPISVLWLGCQFLLLGIADMFTMVGLMDFFYSQAPSGMRSLCTALSWTSISFGYFLSSVLVSLVNRLTHNFGPGQGWLSGDNVNRDHLDRFYWLLCVLTSLNFLNYLVWATWYKYKPLTLVSTI